MKYRIERSPEGDWIMADVWKRGHALLTDPVMNKGTAFSQEERELFDLDGMLPFQPTNRPLQVERAYGHVVAKGDNPLEKYIAMASLLDRNETLFYQVLNDNIEELMPIVYTPTVGEAAVRFSHLFRRGRGLWITPDHKGRIFDVLGHARSEEIKLIVVTDNERILGLGDQGVGGMVIPIGKLNLYTLAAGIHPAYTLPVSLDVGTDNPELLGDHLYAGWRHPRLRGAEYYELVDEFVEAVQRRWPKVVLQWEDFKKGNAFTLLDRYQKAVTSFNDDIQGTAAVVVAGILAYCKATDRSIADQRIILAGAGAAGVGIGRQLRHELVRAGLDGAELLKALTMLGSTGLVTKDDPDLDWYKRDLAWPDSLAESMGLRRGSDLAEVVRVLRPTVLVGTTGQPGVFTEDIVRDMAGEVMHPLIMALSNPTSQTEAIPSDVFEWTDGRTYMATGSPFDPVEYQGTTIPVNQGNNVYVFPGIGLGAIVSEASEVTDAMFGAAAATLADYPDQADLESGRLYPPLSEIRAISRAIAAAVAKEASESGVGRNLTADEIEDRLDREIWDFDYPTLMPA